MMVRLAKAGRRVVRLKSGDPMVFGRAGEEIAVLQQEGIGYEVVPGITAGLAMAAALGISLTHRDYAKSVRLVTGHSKDGGLPKDMNWRVIADPSATTIFYMGGRTAAKIAARLIAEGLAPETPAAIAIDLGRPSQRGELTDLASLGETIREIAIGGPLVIGIGRVFGRLGKSQINGLKVRGLNVSTASWTRTYTYR